MVDRVADAPSSNAHDLWPWRVRTASAVHGCLRIAGLVNGISIVKSQNTRYSLIRRRSIRSRKGRKPKNIGDAKGNHGKLRFPTGRLSF